MLKKKWGGNLFSLNVIFWLMAEANHYLHIDIPIITVASLKHSLQVTICLQYNIVGLPTCKQGYVSFALGKSITSSSQHQINTIKNDRSFNCTGRATGSVVVPRPTWLTSLWHLPEGCPRPELALESSLSAFGFIGSCHSKFSFSRRSQLPHSMGHTPKTREEFYSPSHCTYSCSVSIRSSFSTMLTQQLQNTARSPTVSSVTLRS